METFASYTKTKKGYDDVYQTVKTLEKISASHLHTLGNKAKLLTTYTDNLENTLSALEGCLHHHFKKTPTKTEHTLTFVITGDKGLVGDLWKRLYTLQTVTEHHHILVLGKKGQTHWPKNNNTISHYQFTSRIPSDEEVTSLATKLQKLFESHTYNTISLLYSTSTSLTEQTPIHKILLPIQHNSTAHTTAPSSGIPILESSPKEIWNTLIKKYLKSVIEQAIIDTAISEYSARTVTTEHASSQTKQMMQKLFLTYSRTHRQTQTQKQLERFVAQKTIV